MTTFKEWFDDFESETGEKIEWVVLGWDERDDWTKPKWPDWEVWGHVCHELPETILTKQFDSGFGAKESPNLCAWSESFVIFSDEYDGAESIVWVPRNPTDHSPVRPGGG